ncbi:hypothetical protein TNCV_386751 [Trichonephila clavipes]|nr:hypothetical protein TNCV_386751 [Trichonephila clavipes]
MNLWWLKFDLLSPGIVKAMEPTTEDASDTNDAEAVIIINNAKLINFHAVIVVVKIDGVTIYRSYGELRRSKSFCHLYGAQDQRQAYL